MLHTEYSNGSQCKVHIAEIILKYNMANKLFNDIQLIEKEKLVDMGKGDMEFEMQFERRGEVSKIQVAGNTRKKCEWLGQSAKQERKEEG